nr:TetR family transcriptional regulator [Nonomuraea phyllanthi]
MPNCAGNWPRNSAWIPARELTALQEAILQQDPALSPAAPPAPARTNLPAPLTSLVGRDQAVDEIRCLLAAGRLVTLTGPGGVGKTRLAIETGNRMVQDLPDGVWLVELAGTCRTGDGRNASAWSPGVEEVARTVSASIGLRDDTSESGISLLPSERVADTLHGRRLLLVLDNCEHVIEPVAKLAERLLRAAPGLRILATSREPLALDGETVWPVPPLALPDPAASSADLAQSGAMQLFVQRVTAVSPRFTLNSDNADQVAELCRRLDGLPLALELAATRVPALGVHELVNRLDNRFQLLAAGRRDAPERQQTLRGLLDWSWDLLTEPDRIVLRRLAVHAGGCILPAAETVCAGDEIAPDTVIDVLSRLVDRSLVVVTETPDGPRYQLLETIAEYCLGRLSEAGELDRVRRLFHRYYLDLAKRAEPQIRGPEQHEWLDRVARENTNLCTALGGMIGENDATGALELVTSLVWCWFQLGRLSLARDLLQRALAADGEAPVSLRATAQAWQAGIELLTNVDGEDAARARASATAFDDIDDPQVRARARWFVDYAVYTSKNDRTRAAILHATTGILYQRGLDGVGIDELCAHAGITKETLYHHFGSKDGLIRAVLEARSDRVTRWLAQAADDAGDDPARQLAAIFDALARWYADPDFRGCGIGNAAAQRHSDPATAIAARHLGRYLDLLIDIAARAGVADPAALGRQLLVLLEGATTVADLLSDPGAAAHARDAALTLLRTTARRDDTALGNTARAPVAEPADARR